MSTLNIICDGRLRGKGGIGTYLKELGKRLNVQMVDFSAPIYSLKEQLVYPFQIPAGSIFWSPHFNVPLLPTRANKRIVTIHDLYHLDHPERFSPLQNRGARRLISHAIGHSDLVLTVSEFSKQRLLVHFPKASVSVIPLGGDHLLDVAPLPVAGVPSHFYLFVGSTKPHKNRSLLDGLPIVDVMGNYSEGELVWLYKQADALIFPSLYEGFGFPPLEAFSLGCPVVASFSASIPEVCKDAALYFDPTSRKSLEKALSHLPKERDSLILKGKKRVSELTWGRCAKRYFDLFSAL